VSVLPIASAAGCRADIEPAIAHHRAAADVEILLHDQHGGRPFSRAAMPATNRRPRAMIDDVHLAIPNDGIGGSCGCACMAPIATAPAAAPEL